MSERPVEWAGPIYVDASALVKLFVPEDESDSLNAALSGSSEVVISDLALTEMASAIGRRRREGVLDAVEARRLQREAGKLAGACAKVEITPPVHRHAERLLLSAILSEPLRTLDALHVALALQAQAATFVSYDTRLRRVAESQGLVVVP
ncbi:MAG TPA: type II toxin-antitoxin system VapC family toxin [Jiangellaceae bacterium]|nr:type II toxin-antitoxin system VapC family toxin [Jiangellaceae bacterium]